MGASVCPERVVSESTPARERSRVVVEAVENPPARERSRVVVEAVENLIALLKR
jgi:hypothetical protein